MQHHQSGEFVAYTARTLAETAPGSFAGVDGDVSNYDGPRQTFVSARCGSPSTYADVDSLLGGTPYLCVYTITRAQGGITPLRGSGVFLSLTTPRSRRPVLLRALAAGAAALPAAAGPVPAAAAEP